MSLTFSLVAHQLKEVVLKSGKVLRADVCVIGTGESQSDMPTYYYTASHLEFALDVKSSRKQ